MVVFGVLTLNPRLCPVVKAASKGVHGASIVHIFETRRSYTEE
jgi:hypothetical protein